VDNACSFRLFISFGVQPLTWRSQGAGRGGRNREWWLRGREVAQNGGGVGCILTDRVGHFAGACLERHRRLPAAGTTTTMRGAAARGNTTTAGRRNAKLSASARTFAIFLAAPGAQPCTNLRSSLP